MTTTPLTPDQVERFITDGFVQLGQLVDPAVIQAVRDVLWNQMGLSPDRPEQWTEPVVRLLPEDDSPFAAAFASPQLATVLDQLVGRGRWRAAEPETSSCVTPSWRMRRKHITAAPPPHGATATAPDGRIVTTRRWHGLPRSGRDPLCVNTPWDTSLPFITHLEGVPGSTR